MGDLHVLAAQLAHQFHVVIARDAQSRAELDHIADNAERVEYARPAVHQVADEQGLTACGMDIPDVQPTRLVTGDHELAVAELSQQRLQFVGATMNVPDNVEWAVFVPFVVPKRRPLHHDGLNFFGTVQHEHMAEAFPTKPTKGPPQLGKLLPDDVRAERPLWPLPVAILAETFRHVQHDGDGEAMVSASQLNERLARLRLDIRGVDDGQPAERQPLGGDEVQDLEGVAGDGLVILVVADHAPAGVGGENLGRQKMPARERTLARPAGADQDDERQFGD